MTTEEPASFTSITARILITRDDDENGTAMPSAGAGSVAYVKVWGRTGTYDYQYYSPALVYYENLGNGQARYVAEASSHELGHNLALSHDGTSSVAYYSGHNAGPRGGYVDWAPIMGNSYGADVSRWSRGDYAGANSQQDDLAEIAMRLDYRVDDHGDAESSATPLTIDASGNISSTKPELDPFNDLPDNKGVIEHSSDVDYSVLNLGSGLVDLTVRPAWDAYYHEASRGANLDVHAALYNVAGALVVEDDPATDTGSRIVANVSAGTYFPVVTGVGAGDPVSAYDEYAGLGQYFINGTVPVGSPNGAPTAVNDSGSVSEDGSVVLSVLAKDSGPEGDALSIVSTTQGSHGAAIVNGSTITYTPDPNYNDSDADGDALTSSGTTQPSNGSASVPGEVVMYTPNPGFVGADGFQYSMSDGAGGTDPASVTVTVEDVVTLPDTPANVTASDSGTGIALVAWSACAGADGYEIRRESKHKKQNTWNGTTTVGSTGPSTLSLDDASGAGTYRYQVRAVNGAGASPWSTWVVVTVTDSSGGGGNGKGRRK